MAKQNTEMRGWPAKMGSGRPSPSVRRPTHAGSWYEDDPEILREELQQMLGAEYADGATEDAGLCAVIAPHAGLRFSGSVAAGVYARVDVASVECIFLLGPSHHEPLEGCALPGEEVLAYRTPLGDLPLDLAVLAELRKTHEFSHLPMHVDE
ncbi:Protein MEMO1, partial [Symbiodinium microadriaticum]